MDRRKGKIIVLGGGVTGLAVAWRLAERWGDRVVLLEREGSTGGLAGTLTRRDYRLDLGSHRIHPNYDQAVFALLKEILGDDLLTRPRLGRIRIRRRFVGYPPTPLEILSSFGPLRTIHFTFDYFWAAAVRLLLGDKTENFETYLVRRVGRSLYESFYRPYAQKLWNQDPAEIAAEAGHTRAKKFEFSALLAGLKAIVTGRRPAKIYYYPAGGIGQIAQRFEERFRKAGGSVITGAAVERIDVGEDRRIAAVHARTSGGRIETIEADTVISTLPMNALHSLVRLPGETESLPFDLKMRHLRILFMISRDELKEGSETIYVPDPAFRIGRISQIDRYSPGLNPAVDGHAFAFEVICGDDDGAWTMDDRALLDQCREELRRLGVMTTNAEPLDHFSHRLKNLYPVYEKDWKSKFRRIYDRLDSLSNLYMVGRPALYLHCNIDHCVIMAMRLSDHILGGEQGKEPWRRMVESFFRFQVKD